jgi:ubiquinol-cytochrome c reductase cytochrome b subunit
MKRILKAVGGWFEARLRLKSSLLPVLEHPIPAAVAGPKGWWYVFGSASMTLLFLQIVTGIGLALVYVPAADKAYASLETLNYRVYLGWFLRALHYWSGSGMVVMVLVHMTQVFLHGAYKYPRELTWLFGVGLLLLTLGMMYTGQVLRWDADAYWGVGVGAAMAGRVPWVGPAVVRLLLGDPTIGASTLSRFFALHVFVVPGLLLALVGGHLWLVLSRGISAPPVPGQPVDPKTYDAQYAAQLKKGKPFLGDAMYKDALFSAVVVLVVVALAALFGPKGPHGLPDPTLTAANPRPDWPFLWLFGLLSMCPSWLETFVMLVFPVVLVLALLAVPFVSNRGERAPSRRPMAVLLVLVAGTLLAVLTYAGATAPWSPKMDAWSGDPVPADVVKRSSPLELQGAAVFQNKNCRNCHALEGSGGRRGPDLTDVGTRLSRDQLIDQIANGSPGGGYMPAYGKHVSPAEMEALAAFLGSLRPPGQAPARRADEPASRRAAAP